MPPHLIVPALVLLVLGVAVLFVEPELVTVAGMVVYLLHLPYAVWKYNHLKNHPELWLPAARPRARRSTRRIRLRMPRRLRVAGRLPDGSPAPATGRQPAGERYGRRRGLSRRRLP